MSSDNLITELNKIEEKVYKKLDYDIPNVLYHYTDTNAFIEILKNKKFHVSDVRFMNDYMEIKYLYEKLIPKVCEELKGKVPGFGFCEYTDFKNQCETFTKIQNGVIVDMIKRKHHGYGLDTFSISLSSNKDSYALWSNYSNQEGYNIGININKFIDMFEKNESKVSAKLEKVIYDYNDQKQLIEEDLRDYIRVYLACENKSKDKFAIFQSLYNRFEKYAICFKSESFKQEEEYRIVFSIKLGEDITKFKPRNGIVTPYIEIPTTTTNIDKIPIESVTIGPKINIDVADSGVLHFLNWLGYNTNFLDKLSGKEVVTINKSEITFRF